MIEGTDQLKEEDDTRYDGHPIVIGLTMPTILLLLF